MTTVQEAYAQRVIRGGGCWDWAGIIAKDGYAIVKVGCGRRGLFLQLKAHRVSYEVHIGPIPTGLFVLHKCDNRRCTNPSHLFLGTLDDNMRDRDAKQRQVHGERHPCAKLTDEAVRAIRARHASLSSMAREYGVSISTIAHAARGLTWKHVK